MPEMGIFVSGDVPEVKALENGDPAYELDADASVPAPDDGASAAPESLHAAPVTESEPPVPIVVAAAPARTFHWYVLQVQSGREESIVNNLKKKLVLTKMDQFVEDVVIPKQKVTEIKEGKKRTRKQKLFPGYVFVKACLEDDLWYLIRDTTGIGDFLGSGQKPTPMAESEVRKVLDIMEEKEEAPQVHIDLNRGDTVKISSGPFENFDGVVDEVIPQKGVVRVMVTIFGRSTPVDLEYWQIERL